MTSNMPAGGISLQGPAQHVADLKPGTSSGILLKLGGDVLQEFQNAARDELRFVTGNTPVCWGPYHASLEACLLTVAVETPHRWSDDRPEHISGCIPQRAVRLHDASLDRLHIHDPRQSPSPAKDG